MGELIPLHVAISDGDIKRVKNILSNLSCSERRQLLMTVNRVGRTAFFQALLAGSTTESMTMAMTIFKFLRQDNILMTTPPDAASFLHVIFQVRGGNHTRKFLIKLLQAGVKAFDIPDKHGQIPLRRAELMSGWGNQWQMDCVRILAACGSHEVDRERIGLTLKQVHAIRQSIYFDRPLTRILLEELCDD